jgi:hypothetical protein
LGSVPRKIPESRYGIAAAIRSIPEEYLAFASRQPYFDFMALSMNTVAQKALGLPKKGRVELVEKLLASLAGETDSAVERLHLDEVRKRRTAARSGKATFIDSTAAIKKARAALR